MGGYALSRIGMGINLFLTVISYAIIIRSLLSWFVSPFSGIMRFMMTLTEPFIAPVRALLARLFGNGGMMGLDFSPVITFFLLRVLSAIVRAVFG